MYENVCIANICLYLFGQVLKCDVGYLNAGLLKLTHSDIYVLNAFSSAVKMQIPVTPNLKQP